MIRTLAEKFISINGEGIFAGYPAVFIRFAGCNLNCSYCDTKWANSFDDDINFFKESDKDITSYIKESGINHITLTGGEPLLQKNINELINMILEDDDKIIEIETNGSIDISNVLNKDFSDRIVITMDYKTPSSKEEEKMFLDNLYKIRKNDTIKFVSGSLEDLEKVKYIIKKYNLEKKCSLFISPVFGKIDPKDIVDFIIKNKLNSVRLQLQLHKFIWEPNKKGV